LTGEPVQVSRQATVDRIKIARLKQIVKMYYRRRWNPMSQIMKLEITIHTWNNPYTETPFKTV